jgi:hypothetical protein
MVARGTVTSLGAALALSLLSGAAAAQDCMLRCITIEQFIGEERTARIPLTCDAAALACRGTGTLLIGGTPVPVPIEARYFADAVEVVFQLPFSIESVGSAQRILMSLDDSESQAKNAALRWSTANERPHVTRYLPGHIRILVDRYRRP